MDCRDCSLWDKENERCRNGKVNPRYYDEALIVAQVMGPRALCMFCVHREELLKRMFRPPTPTKQRRQFPNR